MRLDLRVDDSHTTARSRGARTNKSDQTDLGEVLRRLGLFLLYTKEKCIIKTYGYLYFLSFVLVFSDSMYYKGLLFFLSFESLSL